jgi:hypothetical protein
MRKMLAWMILFLVACSSPQNTEPPKEQGKEYLAWEQEDRYTDNTYMDIAREVLRYDVYMDEDGTFEPYGESHNLDHLIASVGKANDNEVQAMIKREFDLWLFRQAGITPGPYGKFLSVRCVAIDNSESDHSAPLFWEGEEAK